MKEIYKGYYYRKYKIWTFLYLEWYVEQYYQGSVKCVDTCVSKIITKIQCILVCDSRWLTANFHTRMTLNLIAHPTPVNVWLWKLKPSGALRSWLWVFILSAFFYELPDKINCYSKITMKEKKYKIFLLTNCGKFFFVLLTQTCLWVGIYRKC